MAQILEVAVREDAVGAIGIEGGVELGNIDARDHRSMANELLRDGRGIRIPAAVA